MNPDRAELSHASRSKVERHLSRLIIEELPGGRQIEHPLSIAEFERAADGSIRNLQIYPFTRELPGTIYHSDPYTPH